MKTKETHGNPLSENKTDRQSGSFSGVVRKSRRILWNKLRGSDRRQHDTNGLRATLDNMNTELAEAVDFDSMLGVILRHKSIVDELPKNIQAAPTNCINQMAKKSLGEAINKVAGSDKLAFAELAAERFSEFPDLAIFFVKIVTYLKADGVMSGSEEDAAAA